MNSGNGKIGYKDCIFIGPGAFEHTVKLADLKAGVTVVNDTYEKVWQTVEIGEGLTVRGEGPFTAKLEGKVIRISTGGRPRVIYVTNPAWLNWVQYFVDDQEFMACWTDYPGSGWGTYKNTALIALSVPAGKHELTVHEYIYPAVWTRKFTPTIQEALVK